MKNFYLCLAMLFCTPLLFGQTVDGINLSALDVKYIQMKVICDRDRDFSISIDFGQKYNNQGRRYSNLVVRNQFGESFLVNSPIDALNFMFEYGYEFLDSSENEGSTQLLSEQKFLLVKRK